jgi:3-hydroxy-D-aspartate aldolase
MMIVFRRKVVSSALNRNIERMASFAQEHRLSLRPHVKTHKNVDVARLQRASGAIGFCCAKIGEAEAMADGGMDVGLHITSPVVTAPAIRRLIELNERTTC